MTAADGEGTPAGLERTRPRRWRGVVLRLLGTVTVFAVLLHFVPLEDVVAAMRRLGPWRWLAAAAAFGAGHALAAAKWWGLVRATGVRPSYPDALRAHAAGLFANTWLPSVIGGDVVRAAWLARGHGLVAPAVAGVVDRVLDLLALMALAALGLFFAGAHAEQARGALRLVALLLGGGVVVGLLMLAWLDPERLPHRARGPAARLVEVRDALRRRPGAALRAFLLALVVQGGFICLNAWLGHAVGLDLDLAVWLAAWPLAKLAALAPVSLGGLGVREAALTGLLAPFGAPAPLVVGQGLLWQSVIFGFGFAAGLGVLATRRR